MQNQRPPSIHDARYKNAIASLIRARKAAGLSQSELANKIGFSQPDISKIERLERRLDIIEFIDVLQAISNGNIVISNQIWEEINECYRRYKKRR